MKMISSKFGKKTRNPSLYSGMYTWSIKNEIRHFTITERFFSSQMVKIYVPDHTDYRNNGMVTLFVFLFLAGAIFRETSTEMAVKTVNVVVEMELKVQNFAVKPLACSSWIHLSFEHFDVISVVDKSTDQGKLLSVCLIYVVVVQ